MAIYIHIKKKKECTQSVVYEYSCDDGRSGLLELNTKTGEATNIRQMENDNENRNYLKAAFKLKKYWQKGVLPEVTSWSS